MERVYLPSDKVLGLDMPDKRYNARPGSGYVEVDDLHAAVLRQYTGLQVGQMFSAPVAASRTCSVCNFEQYAAMAGDKCNRCGGEWETVVLADNSKRIP